MPIRASVLRRPASNAATRLATVVGRRQLLGAARPASSAASSMASRGWTAVAPTARTIAIAWTSRTSAASTHEVGPAAQAGLGQRGVDGADRQDRRDRQALEPTARRR